MGKKLKVFRYLYRIFFYSSFCSILFFTLLDVWKDAPSIEDRYLYYPEDWMYLSRINEESFALEREPDIYSSSSVGGHTFQFPPLDIKIYTVKPEDTLSGIAYKFGLELDTLASINRDFGKGVHFLSIGEKLQIPTFTAILQYFTAFFNIL